MKRLAFLFSFIMLSTSAFAHTVLSTDVQNAWGGKPSWILCQPTNTQGCIGKELIAADCSARKANLGIDYGHAYLFMLARKVNQNGAYFCPTQFMRNGENSSLFAEPLGNNTCIWLCREGYTGNECLTKVSDYTGICDITPFLRENYNNVKPKDKAQNIEYNFPYFDHSKRTECYSSNLTSNGYSVEHDILLAIDKFLPSGNGAWARQMEFSAMGIKGGKMSAADLHVYPASGSSQILVCKNGYQPNISNTDCEPINASTCSMAQASTKMCAGWNISGYREDMHVLETTDACYKYKCKNIGQTFASTTDHTCIDCTSNDRGGPHPIDGTCVKCDTGYIFNKNDTENNYCSKAIGLTKLDMMYGRGKTKSSYNDENSVTKQCWTKTDPNEYRECVLGTNNAVKQNPVITTKILLPNNVEQKTIQMNIKNGY